MYHRIYFNLLAMLLMLIEVGMTRDYKQSTKIIVQCGILVFFTLYCYVTRPYRSDWTNVILCLGMAGLSMQVILI